MYYRRQRLIAFSIRATGMFCVLLPIGCESGGRIRPAAPTPATYRGIGDASAGVGLDASTFVVADDEHNTLRLYRVDRPEPIASIDLSVFLKPEPVESEVDIEAAARLGERIYWITSHDTNKRGQTQPNRDYFLATQVRRLDGRWTVDPTGTPSRNLVEALLGTPGFRELVLRESRRREASSDRKTEKEAAATPLGLGLKIEGLCAWPDGNRLYMGFRQPRLGNDQGGPPKALVIALENPAEVVDAGAAPRFGQPLLWDLGGLVIRGMEYSATHNAVFVVAGPEKQGPHFSLYRWNGDPSVQPVLVRSIPVGQVQLTPESLIVFPGQSRMLIVSDDGELIVPVGGAAGSDSPAGRHVKNKEISDPAFRQFRTMWVDLR